MCNCSLKTIVHYIKVVVTQHKRKQDARELSALISIFDGNPLTVLLIALIETGENNMLLAQKQKIVLFYACCV